MEAGPVLRCLQPLLGLVAPLPPEGGSIEEELAQQAQRVQQQAGRGLAAAGAGGEGGLEEARLPLVLHAHDTPAGSKRAPPAAAANPEAASMGGADSGPRLS